MKTKKNKKYILMLFVCLFTFISFVQTNKTFVYANSHIHNDNCYTVLRHEHGSACYYDANAGGCGTDTIEWKVVSTKKSNCINCSGIYEYSFYSGICSGCNKEYTDTVYGTCNSCGNIMRPLKDGNSIYPKYPNTKCTYQIQGQSLMLLSCDKEEDKYYNSDGSFANPECDKVAVSILAHKQLQSGKEVDTNIEVTFLDGHKENLVGISNFDSNKQYNNSDVTIYYEGIVTRAGNKGTLSTIIKMTTPYNLPTQAPVVQPTIVVTQTPTQIVTPTPNQNFNPTKVPTTNTNNGGNRLETNNQNSNSNISNKNNSGSKFSNTNSNTSRGETVANNKNNTNTTNTNTSIVTPTIEYKKREAIKVKITRPLTEEEKQEKIDGTMVLTKLYRNEENDVIGVQKKKEENKPTNTVISGTVNKGNTQEVKGKIMIFVLFFVVFAIIIVIGGYIFIKKRKEEYEEPGQIDLQSSIRF